MKNYYDRVLAYIKIHKVATAIVVIIIAIGGYYSVNAKGASGPTQYVLASVTQDTVISSITGSGSISAEDQVSVTPQGSGKVVSVNVQAGQTVSVGQTIAVLDESSASISLEQAKANLASAQASYNKTAAGISSTDLASDQASLASAQLSLQDSETNLLSKIGQSYISTRATVVNDTFPFFTNPLLSNSTLSIYGVTYNNSVLVSQVENDFASAKAALSNWQTDTATYSTSTDVVAASNQAIGYLNQIDTYFNDLAILFNSYAVGSSSTGQSSVTTDKSLAANDQSSVESTITSITSALQSYQSAQLSFAQSQASFNSQTAPPDTATLAQAQASLTSAQASYQSALDAYNNNIVSAPIAGVVADVAAHVGDQGGSGTAIATIITQDQFATIPLNEIDVSKVAIGDKATLTFDALPTLTMTGKVVEIDPIGTVSSGVVNYNVKIALDTQNDQVKPNMSVTANIVTGVDQNVLVVPNSAVQTSNGVSYVELVTGISTSTPATPGATGAVVLNGTPVATQVTVGLSNDTETEISSGLNEGDIVVQQTVASTVAKATTVQSGLSLLGGTSGARGGFTGGTGGGARTTTAAPAAGK